MGVLKGCERPFSVSNGRVYIMCIENGPKYGPFARLLYFWTEICVFKAEKSKRDRESFIKMQLTN